MSQIPLVELTIDVKIVDERLDLRYTLRNRGSGAIGVYNRIRVPTIDGTTLYDPDAAYIAVTADEVHLQNVYLKIPAELAAAEKLIPEVSRLDAGGELKEHLSLPLPVRVLDPYRRALLAARAPSGAQVEPAKLVLAKSVRLTVGFFPILAGMKLTPVSPAWPEVYRVFPPSAAIDGQLFASATATTSHPVPVLDYDIVSP